ncbi:hypothetical protein SB767_36275, partial [Bacillus sp. SIMBA_069]
ADAGAAVTRSPPALVAGVLLDRIPTTDRDLLALSDDLAQLERATAVAVSPSAAPPAPGPTGRMDA